MFRAPSQVSKYKPLPIYDWKSGLNLRREPWLLPKDAFSNILNFHIRQGVLQKRLGYTKFAEMVHKYSPQIGTGDGATTDWSGTLANTPIRKESSKTYFQFTDNNGQVLHDEDMDGSLSGDGTGSIDYDTGDYSISFSSAPPDSAVIECIYNHLPGLPIVGIYNYWSGTGDRQLLFFDTKRVNIYYPNQGKTQDLTASDEFTGSNEDYIQMESWEGNSYITNNVDQMKKYDGSSLSDFSIDTDNDGTNDVNNTLMIFAYHGHLIILRPTENGTLYPQRARWSAAGSSNNWHDGGFVDAPTLDWIMSASFLGDRLIVEFERSIWALNYIGDVDLPFQWEKLVATEGCAATMSTVPFSDELMFLGPVEFVAFDGVSASHLSKQVPEISLTFNQDQYSTVYGAVLEEEHEVLWNYPAFDSSYPDHNLVYNYWLSNWTIFDIPIQALGYYQETENYTWDNIDKSWDELMFTWDSKEIQAGYPITLGGMQDGTIVRLNDSGNDLGNAIDAYAQTKAINPWYDYMMNARLGYIDVYYSEDSNSTATIRVYETDNFSSPYFEKTISLDAPGNLQKGMARIPVNGTARGHRIEIANNKADNAVDIHAIVPWMKPAGRIINL